MGLGRFSSYLTTGWMDDVEAATKWLSVVSTDPLATSSPTTAEIVGGTVTRMASSWVRTGANCLTLDAPVAFTGLPPGAHVAGLAAFDGPTGGNLLFADLLDAPENFPDGGTYNLAAGEYVVGLDLPGA